MTYQVDYTEDAINDLRKISKSDRSMIKKAIEERLIKDPIAFGKPLRHSLKGLRRLRVGDWRVIHQIEPNQVVLIIAIGNRKDIYE